MAKKINRKVSVSKLDSVCKEMFSTTITADWHGVEISITKNLSLSDMLSFVADVVAKCFDENGDYFPELMDFAIKENILTRYANFTMPGNVEHEYSIIYQTDAVDFVCEHINSNQLKDIVESIEEKLDYIQNTNIVFIRARVNKLVDAIDDLQTKANNIFSNVTKDDVDAVIKSVVRDGSLDETKIVKAYADIMARQSKTDGNDES